MSSSWVGLDVEIPEGDQTQWLGLTYGFWVKDHPLAVWLTALGETVDKSPNAPDWLKSLREEWRDPAYGGVIYTGLNEHLIGDGSRMEILYSYVLEALEELLKAAGDYHVAFKSTKGLTNLPVSAEQPV